MAINLFGPPSSVAWTGGSATSPLSHVQSYDYQPATEIEAFKLGTARVKGHYQGDIGDRIVIETADMAAWSDFVIGDVVTNLIVTVEAATETDGTAVGSNTTITFSKARLVEKGSVAHDNANKAPVVASLTFELSRAAADGSDPTVAIAAVA